MTALARLAAWAWDHVPGGVPTQLWLWNVAPALADWCERAAQRHDTAS